MTNQFGNVTQWRITMNHNTGPVIDDNKEMSESWQRIAEYLDARSGKATLETRTVFPDDSIMPLLTDPAEWRVIKGKAFSPWSIQAEIETR